MRYLSLVVGMFVAVQLSGESIPLSFNAEQVNGVVAAYQRAHYCSPYRKPQRTHKSANKVGLVEMWADDATRCDLTKQRNTFYDSVWRDAVRLETIVNYKAYFGASLPGSVDLSSYAVDDGFVSKQMMDLLTTNTEKTFGAQNDDVMWWALAFLRAYEYNPSHTAYLKAAKAVFERIQHTPEQTVCGGGVTWGDGTQYKNAITNALYLRLAVRLAGFSPSHAAARQRYLRAATTEADWLIERSGLWVSGGLLADGIHFKGDVCSTEPELTVWTYSQGVAISGLAQLTLLTGEKRYADRAQALLLRALDGSQEPALVNGDGILKELSTTPAKANEDAQTFKGIFVENVGYALPYFNQADAERYAPAAQRGKFFLVTNANAVWKTGREHAAGIEFPFDWTDSAGNAQDPATMRTTAAALDLFNAAWSVQHLQRDLH